MTNIELESLNNLLISKSQQKAQLADDFRKAFNIAVISWIPGMIMPTPSVHIQTLTIEIALLERLIKGVSEI